MTSAIQLEFPLAKAEYLLTYQTKAGVGGDKQNFWRNYMGFQSAEAIREAILKEVSPSLLQPQGENEFGNLYRAYVIITAPNGLSRRIRTVWIVKFNETIARFVTAIPDRLGG
jgi:hypothetical protein